METDYDGRLLVQCKMWTAQSAKAGLTIDENNFFSVPFQMFIAGDLAFFQWFLAKDHRQHAATCDLTSSQWKPQHHEKGTVWTLDRLLQMNQQLTDRNRIVKGVKWLPLLTTLEVNWFLPPTMHIMLGVGNTLLDNCLKFLDTLNGFENVPDNVWQAWQIFYDLHAIKIDAKEELDAWIEFLGPQLVEYRESRLAIIHYIIGDCRYCWLMNK